MKMKPNKIIVGLVSLLIAVPTMAQPLIGQQGLPKPYIKLIGFLGRGVAITPEDPLNFKLVKAGVGIVRVSWAGEETELTVGVLFLDGERYRLKNLEIGNESVTGDLYLNDTKVGSLDVSSVTKDDTTIWFGTLQLEKETFYIYILEARRPIRPIELREKVSDYCREHPRDPNCRTKIEQYCQNNPEDVRCKEILKKYCITHLNDSRCRIAIKNYCKEHPTSLACRYVKVKAENFCLKYPEKCKVIKRIIKVKRIGNETEVNVTVS